MEKEIKVLNCYARIGGNRKLWKGVEVTAIENNKDIAGIYKDFFPDDEVLIADAHQFILDWYDEYDFIWSSPPCPSHSRIRNEAAVGCGQNEAIYPDMNLYQEIIFLKHFCKNKKWVVENVISYYKPLIKPFIFKEHYYWSNFIIDGSRNANRGHMGSMSDLRKIKGFDITRYKNVDERKILRNCVEPKSGLHVFNCAFKTRQVTL